MAGRLARETDAQFQEPVDQVLPLQVEPDQVLPDQVLPDQVLPDQVLPDQLSPLQVEPDQVLPDQVLPDQVLPDHVQPDQLSPLQLEPDQLSPLQVLPFHVPPDQLLPAASRTAIAGALKLWPKMSCSPLRTTPASVRWSDPRERSSDPTPVDRAMVFHLAGATFVGAVSVARRSTMPAPARRVESPSRPRAVMRNSFLS